LGNTADRRLQTLHHEYPGGATLSKFDYIYNAAGNILTWQQQADAAVVAWAYGYDAADQLVSAVNRATDVICSAFGRCAGRCLRHRLILGDTG